MPMTKEEIEQKRAEAMAAGGTNAPAAALAGRAAAGAPAAPNQSRLTLARAAIRPEMKGRVMMSGPPGAGKALRDDQPVLTPTGWLPIGAIDVGDTVYGVDGRPCLVTGVFPQGVRPLFEIVFSDGVIVVADEQHRWFTQTRHERRDGKPGSVRTTVEIAEKIRDGDGRAWQYVPMAAPAEHCEADLPLDPYVLGLLLGDGGMSQRGVTFSCPDDELVDTLGKHFELTKIAHDPIGWYVIGAPAVMRTLGLLGHRSTEKFVPGQYMLGSPSQRLALVQGLLDTDGYASGHNCEWTTSSERLAEQFVELVQSLGGTVTVSDRLPTYTYKGERRTGSRSWRCYVKLPGDVEPFRLTRKAVAFTPRTKYQPVRQIVDVRPVEPGLATCISVDAADHLFLTAGYVPTHNTYTSLVIATVLVGQHGRILVVDSEKESSLTYADVFQFEHLRWNPPFDPTALSLTLKEAAAVYDCVIVDSFSHFWRKQGGVLDIAGDNVRGWKAARPIQENLIETLLDVDCHVIVCCRSKMEHLIDEDERGRMRVTKAGIKAQQDDDLEYEVNVALELDMPHVLHIVKSRTNAVPVGTQYLAGLAGDFAQQYRDWLRSGEPVADKAATDALAAGLDQIADQADRQRAKYAFLDAFGRPEFLLVSRLAEAQQWVVDAVRGALPVERAEDAVPPEPEATEDAPASPVAAAAPPSAPVAQVAEADDDGPFAGEPYLGERDPSTFAESIARRDGVFNGEPAHCADCGAPIFLARPLTPGSTETWCHADADDEDLCPGDHSSGPDGGPVVPTGPGIDVDALYAATHTAEARVATEVQGMTQTQLVKAALEEGVPATGGPKKLRAALIERRLAVLASSPVGGSVGLPTRP